MRDTNLARPIQEDGIAAVSRLFLYQRQVSQIDLHPNNFFYCLKDCLNYKIKNTPSKKKEPTPVTYCVKQRLPLRVSKQVARRSAAEKAAVQAWEEVELFQLRTEKAEVLSREMDVERCPT